MKKILLNHSNHPSSKWDESQKQGWDVIIDIPFPLIPASADTAEVEKMAEEGFRAILSAIANTDSPAEVWACILGEYTYVYSLVRRLPASPVIAGLAVPTTERVVVEEDGGRKTSIFQFVRWRLLPLR